MVDCLVDVPASELQAQAAKIPAQRNTSFLYLPVVAGEFFSDDPVELYNSGDFAKVYYHFYEIYIVVQVNDLIQPHLKP